MVQVEGLASPPTQGSLERGDRDHSPDGERSDTYLNSDPASFWPCKVSVKM
jgi:hypothetical protein